jgi:hypothetical protein
MSFPSFLLPWFAIAGAVAAAGPILIHLLNRQRYRVVQWAAMDFLREAIHRSRRILQLRDLLLMVLRVGCLLAFGAALARPYWTSSADTVLNPDQPVHAVVLVDNSLSMSYQKLEGTLLDDAKAKAKELIEGLPRGSRISVVPVCGTARGVNGEPHPNADEAIEALGTIQAVDRAARPGAVIDLALEACRKLPTMPAKRIFLVTDQQVANWPAEALTEHLKQLPGPLQVSQVTPDEIDNAWVADVKLRDGMADTQSPTVLVATIGYQGLSPREGVEVSLSIDGAVVASQAVSLQPGQVREVEFPPYRFDLPAEPGKPTFATAEVSISHDRLPADDHRFLVVPVMAALPVVFVDQCGQDEDPQRNRYGDTYWLRRLLAPRANRANVERQLIQVRHLTIDQLTRESLADARLVIIAGVPRPEGSVPLLREYVAQGGNLLLAAGGDFDPAAWTEQAWADGLGILPMPLKQETVGFVREHSDGQSIPFVLDFDTLVHQYFWPKGVAEDELRALFGPPTLFFKAVVADTDPKFEEQLLASSARELTRQRGEVVEIDRKLAEIDSQQSALRSKFDSDSSRQRADLDRKRGELQASRGEFQPSWLVWKARGQADEPVLPVEDQVQRTKPQVMGRYNNGLPFLVRRSWGRGQVLLWTSSLSPQWTTIPNVAQSWWLMDRMVRDLLVETLPSQNVETERSLVLPVAVGERSARIAMKDPDGQEQALSVDALGGDRYGVSLGNWIRRGVYRVSASRGGDASEAAESKLWEVPLAVNGPDDESALAAGASGVAPIAGQHTFLDVAQASAFTFVQFQGVDLWKWLIVLVLVGLLAELGLAAWFYSGLERSR